MRIILTMLLLATLAGCTAEEPLVTNGCTEHPNYGSGNPLVTIETNMGNITGEIFVDKAPNTGMNFVKLVEAGTLDNVPFHRIISDFMVQGGDHTNENGSGGEAHPDCANSSGDIIDEYSPELRHDSKGVFSMANAGPGTGSSQFFITFRATDWLDGYDEDGNLKDCGEIGANGYPISCHAVFGKVVEGLDVLDAINAQAGTQSGAPATPVTFRSGSVAWP